MLEVYFDNRQSGVTIDKDIYALLERVIKNALILEGKDENYEISVSFVDNHEIQELNKEYRGVDRDTDVLSFPMDDDFMVEASLLGDIIISAEKALEQSKEYNHSLERELAYLTAHSMFHLMGYDHMTSEDKEAMRTKEKALMKKLGIFKELKGE